MSTVKKKSGAGRPIEFKYDLNEVEKLCALSCTDAEVGAYFKVCTKTIQREKARNPDFNAAIEQGRNYGKLSLRRRQLKIAESGNVTMLIWLGKQMLAQTDKVQQEVSGPDGKPQEHKVTWSIQPVKPIDELDE